MKDRLDNLKNARCYEDKDGVGGKVSKWFNLSKFDVEWAVFEIERLRSPPDVFYEYDEKKSAFLRDRIEVLESALQWVVDTDPALMRTADQHFNCNCHRCAMDNARSLLERKE